MRHLIGVFDLSTAEIERIFAIAEDLKSKYDEGLREPLLPGRVAALLFEKPSLRTRVSFEAAMAHLGGTTLFLGAECGWGTRESVEDFSRVISQYVDVVICRAKSHAHVKELARHCQVPVINGLTDLAHPCQALADLYTLRELRGNLTGASMTFVGDGNNVARSLAVACGRLGVRFTLAAPPAYQFDKAFHDRLKKELPQADIRSLDDPAAAVQDASAIYTDVWTSMGQESEDGKRQRDLARFQVNAALMSAAPADAVFLHCLPARRGQEVTDEVIDSPQSAVVQQAANRMHVQKGILAWLLATHGRDGS